ncbi:MAG: hypothetical protein ABI977_03680 [Acidobacteriota bacterium]
MQNLKRSVLRHVLSQIERDMAGLSIIEPNLGWKPRVEKVARQFIPRLVEIAPKLKQDVALVLNSPHIIRETWARVKNHLEAGKIPAEIKKSISVIERELEFEARLLSVITGETVSNLISDFLCREFPDLKKNNRSTYPDLYFASFDYSKLPFRKRGNAMGPALRGSNPTSVPDGIEIKSQRGRRIRVDCHHDHQGLHLVMTFNKENEVWSASDVYVAYLAKSDYARATRNTTATTEKFSFSHATFISAISGASAQGEIELP